MKAVKKNRRLVIVNDQEEVVYCPPDFVRPYIRDRVILQELADRLKNDKGDIQHIMVLSQT